MRSNDTTMVAILSLTVVNTFVIIVGGTFYLSNARLVDPTIVAKISDAPGPPPRIQTLRPSPVPNLFSNAPSDYHTSFTAAQSVRIPEPAASDVLAHRVPDRAINFKSVDQFGFDMSAFRGEGRQGLDGPVVDAQDANEQAPDVGRLSGANKRGAFDVSEGTKFDPLKNRSYDLNNAQQMPANF